MSDGGNEHERETIEIERASVDDAQEILDLQKLAYQSEAAIYDDYTIAPLTQTLAEMRADLERQTVLKATIDGWMVGSVRGVLQDGTCYAGRLIVRPEMQNRGIGTRLVRALEETFGQAERYELFTGHRSERNLYLYQKLGYQICRQEQVSPALTLVYLEKRPHREE